MPGLSFTLLLHTVTPQVCDLFYEWLIRPPSCHQHLQLLSWLCRLFVDAPGWSMMYRSYEKDVIGCNFWNTQRMTFFSCQSWMQAFWRTSRSFGIHDEGSALYNPEIASTDKEMLWSLMSFCSTCTIYTKISADLVYIYIRYTTSLPTCLLVCQSVKRFGAKTTHCTTPATTTSVAVIREKHCMAPHFTYTFTRAEFS